MSCKVWVFQDEALVAVFGALQPCPHCSIRTPSVEDALGWSKVTSYKNALYLHLHQPEQLSSGLVRMCVGYIEGDGGGV